MRRLRRDTPMKRVVYVERSTTAQSLMRRCLEGVCEITGVSTLSAAFEIVNEREFDLLITDFLFSDDDVSGLIEHVRQIKPWDELPIIVISASMDKMLMSRVVKIGANDAASKPLRAEEF